MGGPGATAVAGRSRRGRAPRGDRLEDTRAPGSLASRNYCYSGPPMRRRLLAAILIIATNLFLLAWVDDQLLLRNPIELDTRARLILRQLFPEQNPDIGHIEVDFSSRRVIAENLEFFEKTTNRSLLKVKRVEATLSLTDWLAPREVHVQGVTGHLRLRGERLNIEDLVAGADTGRPTAARTSQVAVSVQDVRIDFEDENTGSHSLAICEHAELAVQPDGRVTGTGHARVGALVKPSSPFAAGGAPVDGHGGLLYREIVQKLDFEIDRRADGRTAVPVYIEHVSIGPLLRSLLPPYVQNEIWSELNPEGIVDANVVVTLGVKQQGPHFSITINSKNVSLRPKKFPYPIRDINGRFEVAVGPGPIVAWEDVTARLSGDGRVTKARGAFFLGSADEKVSLFIHIDAQDIPCDETLHEAMPADIRGVYDQFNIKGQAGPSKVIIFKGPHMDEPQLSIRSTVDGRQSAAFGDYPVRFTAKKGTFTLKEGGNVEVNCEGALEGGGTAVVDARVVHGDLIHVRVKGEHVLVTQPLLAKLDEPVRRMVEPFRPRGGEMGFDLTVEKSDPAGQPRPRVTVTLSGVTVAPDIFPYRLRTDGTVHVRPLKQDSSPTGGMPEIQVDLALTANARAVTAAVISGSVVLDPKKKDEEFHGSLTATCARLDADGELRRALPLELRKIVERLAPEGALRDVKATIRSLRSFDAEGTGAGMTTALDAFPYRVSVDGFAISREDRLVTLQKVEGKGPAGGRYSLEGKVELPPEGSNADPFIQVGVEAKGIAIEPGLLAALPGDARASLEKLSPSGGALDASLKVAIAPALGLDLTGSVELAGTKFFLDKLDPGLEGLKGIPVEDVTGRLRLDGERVWIDGLRAKFRGVPVSAGGSIAMATRGGAEDGVAPDASATTVDLVAHVDGLLLDEPTRALGRGPVAAALQRFPLEGKCDLDFRLQRRAQGDPAVEVRVRPRGVRVVPKILPFDFEDVNGTIDVRGGEPDRVELSARLGRAEIEVRRDKRLEAFAEKGTSVFTVKAKGVRPEELLRAPEDFARTVKDFDIKGAVDLNLSVAIPSDERAKQHFVAELKTSDFAVTSGIRFEKCKGALRVSGSVAKFEPLELEGTFALDSAEWKQQQLLDARIPLRLRDGVLSIGTSREPFVGKLYDGQLRGRVTVNLKTPVAAAYTGSLYLQEGKLRVAADQLAKLGKQGANNGPKQGGTGPVKGDLTARLDFQGGGVSEDKRPIGLSGDAVFLASNANFIPVPFVLGGFVDIVKGVTRGDSSFDPKTFDKLYTKLRLRPTKIDIELFQLASDTLALRGTNGRLDWDGEIELDLVPYKTGAVFDEIFKQFVAVRVRGTVGQPETNEIPFYSGLEKVWNFVRSAFSSATPDRVGETVPPNTQPPR